MLALLFLAGVQAAQVPVPTFPAGVAVVTVDAVVLDDEGNPVPGLTRDDFVVTEDGRPQEIVGFEAFGTGTAPPSPPGSAPPTAGGEAPRSAAAFAIVLDDLRLVPAHAEGARRAAATFLERSVHDGDEVTLATTSGSAWWSARLPEGREDLLALLARVRGRYVEPNSLDRMSEYEAYWINTHESGPPHHAPVPDRPGRTTAAETQAAETGDFTGFSVRERVKNRWKQANLCTATSCDTMVRVRATDIDAQRQARTRSTLAALRRGVGALAPMRGRKSLLFLSEAMIDESTSELRSVIAAAREANTAVYFVDVSGLVALPGGGSAADAEPTTEPGVRLTMGVENTVLEIAGGVSLADETGGFAVRNTNDFAAGAGRIAAESRVYYLLGFNAPEGKAVDKWRKLKVEVKRPGLKVRARRGYTLRAALGTEGAKPAKKAKKPTLEPAVAQALDSAHDAAGLPVRAMAYVFEPRPPAGTRVVVTAEFDARSPSSGGASRGGRFELSIVVTHRDTGREFPFDGALAVKAGEGEGPTWRALAREFDLPPGVAQARVVVRDPTSGALGSVSRRFEVPAPEAFRLSTPVLTDRVEPNAGDPSHPRPVLTAQRVFHPEGRLYCQFEVFGAARPGNASPRVAAGLALRAGDGRIVLEAPPTPITPDRDGGLVRLLGLPLDGLAEGAYELRLDVLDETSGAHLERREPFTLSRS